MSDGYRIERDTMGEVRVPAHALWGAQTQRAVENFRLGGGPMPRGFIEALGLVKAAAAHANRELGLLDPDTAAAVAEAAEAVAAGEHDGHFPVDVYQTGSGTSSNMNANEVIARLASRRLGRAVHPNDEVNRCQSSNDVVPSAIHLAAVLAVERGLGPDLAHLAEVLAARAAELDGVVKTGRTHLMDAMPVTFGQEIGGWEAQVRGAASQVDSALGRVRQLALGATAVGTGVNAHPDFGPRAVAWLAARCRTRLETTDNRFAAIAAPDAAAALSAQVRVAALALTKIANDLRWMNSGPLAGLAEIRLPALQPGSSIMPGKVNPVIPEAVGMACAQVVGHDAALALAAQGGQFELNVMLPLVARNLLESIRLVGASARSLADRAVAGFTVDRERVASVLDRNPVLATALAPVIGYEAAARVARRAAAEGRPVLDVARELTDLPEARLRRLLDPAALVRGGFPGLETDGD